MSTTMSSPSFPQAAVLPSRTGRIKLIKSSEENDSAVCALRTHPEVRKYLRFFPEHFSLEDARLLRERRAADPSAQVFDVLKCEPNGKTRYIGGVSAFHLDELHKSCEAGIIISPDLHRSGVASDALYTLFTYLFEDLKLHRICMKTESTNESMRGWLEKVAGARLEAQERGAWTDPVNGGYSDVVGYAILELEWKERVKGVLEDRLGL